MEKILRTKSGNEVYITSSNHFAIKGNIETLKKELSMDLNDPDPDIHNTAAIIATFIEIGNYSII